MGNGDDDFIIHSPTVYSKKTPLSKGGGPAEVFIDDYPSEDKERAAVDIFDQIKETVSEIRQKILYDQEKIYFRLDLKSKINHPVSTNVLTAISAELLAFLDSTYRHLLVSARPSSLTNISRKYEIKNYVSLIRPMNEKDQLILEENNSGVSPYLLHIIPNISQSKHTEYTKEIEDYLNTHNYKINQRDLDKLGVIQIFTEKPNLFDLIEDINYIYCIESLPKGIATDIKVQVQSHPSTESYRSSNLQSEKLPLVIVMDTGLNNIQKLRDFVEFRDKYGIFENVCDEYPPEGHGTPISNLVVFGEENSHARARVGSFKIFSPGDPSGGVLAIMEALDRYSNESRLFVSSINFPRNLKRGFIFQKLNNLVQEKNIVVAFSAGNICDYSNISLIEYPYYLTQFPIDEPGSGISITSVGAVVKYASDIAEMGMPSPFSKSGHSLNSLFDCPKPEVAYHGGNFNSARSTEGLGVKSVSKNGDPKSFTGTSFSSPQFIRVIAQIDSKYGDRIRNAETLKTLSILSSKEMKSIYVGFGSPKPFIHCKPNQAVWIFEGELSFPYTETIEEGKKYKITTYHDLNVEVPFNVSEITLCIVHSDNYKRNTFPSLNTFIEIEAEKLSNRVKQDPLYISGTHSHIRMLRWKYQKKSMGGAWKFRISPNYTDYVLTELRKDITVRYGCSILLEANNSNLEGKSVTQMCYESMNRYR